MMPAALAWQSPPVHKPIRHRPICWQFGFAYRSAASFAPTLSALLQRPGGVAGTSIHMGGSAWLPNLGGLLIIPKTCKTRSLQCFSTASNDWRGTFLLIVLLVVPTRLAAVSLASTRSWPFRAPWIGDMNAASASHPVSQAMLPRFAPSALSMLCRKRLLTAVVIAQCRRSLTALFARAIWLYSPSPAASS